MMRFALSTLLEIGLPFAVMAQEKFVSKEGKYSVTLPKAPTETAQEVPTAAGKIKTFIASVEVRKDLAVIVLYNDYPDAVVKMSKTSDLLDRVRDGFKGANGKISDEKEIAQGKIPGRTYLVDKENNFAQVRAFLNGNRLYQVIVIGSKKEDATSPEAKKIFDSFEIAK